MRYIFQYTLPYQHRGRVGIEAESRGASRPPLMHYATATASCWWMMKTAKMRENSSFPLKQLHHNRWLR